MCRSINFKFHTNIEFGMRINRNNAHKIFVGKAEGMKIF
jgi:hypothetical protein